MHSVHIFTHNTPRIHKKYPDTKACSACKAIQPVSKTALQQRFPETGGFLPCIAPFQTEASQERGSQNCSPAATSGV